MVALRNVEIIIRNETRGELKVTEFAYLCIKELNASGTWKVEQGMFGVDGHQRIEQHRGFQFQRNLEGLRYYHDLHGTELFTMPGFPPSPQVFTQFRVTYNHRIGGDKWGPDKVAFTDPITLRDDDSKTVTLTE